MEGDQEKINKNVKIRCWALTIFKLSDLSGFEDDRVKYGIAGDEICPTTGRFHKQSFVYFHMPQRFAAVKKLFPTAFIKPKYKGATIHDNIRYCSKELTNVQEWGTRPMSQEDKGEVEKQFWDDIKESAKQGQMDLIPSQIYIRHKRTFDEMAKEHKWKTSKATCDIVELRDWQTELVEYIEGPIHPREILFIVDPEGGKGKSSMAVYLQQNYGAQVFSPGKKADIYYLIEPGNLFIFDCSAADANELDHGMLEAIKNGYFQSTKYEPVLKQFPRPHVVVFCNNMIQSTLIPDRLKIKYI